MCCILRSYLYIRHKWKVKRGWIKVSLVIDRFTKELLDVQVSLEGCADYELAKKHLANLQDVEIEDLAGDGAYYVEEFYKLLEKYGISPVIKMPKNASPNGFDPMHRAVREMEQLYAYLLDNALGLPKGLPGYFVGDPENPSKGSFEGRNNLRYAVAKVAKKNGELSTLVDMNFEGLARDSRMTLLLQPIQENPEDYPTVNQLIEKYLPDHKFISPDGWQKQATILIK